MDGDRFVSLGVFGDAEKLVIRPLLEQAGIDVWEKLETEGEILRLYTSSPGYAGTQLLVRERDEKMARELLDL